MNKHNFFNFREKNMWDIGWPCSPRTFVLILIPIISFLFLFVGCMPEKKLYRVTIEVHLPTRIDTVTVDGESYNYPQVGSDRGTNYVAGVYETTAPIKIISVKEIR